MGLFPKVRFAIDSPLEEDGFEPSVPPPRGTADVVVSEEIFLLFVLQHLRQLRISAIAGQDEDHL